MAKGAPPPFMNKGKGGASKGKNPFAKASKGGFGKNPKAAAAGPPVAMPFKKGGKV
jgi:hypothetical protein